MVERVEFHNFKVLRDTTLPLEPFTLIVGPNGSGKSTAIQGIGLLRAQFLNVSGVQIVSLQRLSDLEREADNVSISLHWAAPESFETRVVWGNGRGSRTDRHSDGRAVEGEEKRHLEFLLSTIRTYSLHPPAIASPATVQPNVELESNGERLAAVLDRLRGSEPERFDALNAELGRWIPEFDYVLLDTPQDGCRGVMLRTRAGHQKIKAVDLSQGTLLALVLLTLAYLPDPPSILCLEEPDRGLHPRLLREVRDALYRLAYPADFGESRRPVQVIATTHSPYFVDLFRDQPEQIVLAEKVDMEAKFHRLSDHPHLEDILDGASLGEVWYSGILGGVPVAA